MQVLYLLLEIAALPILRLHVNLAICTHRQYYPAWQGFEARENILKQQQQQQQKTWCNFM